MVSPCEVLLFATGDGCGAVNVCGAEVWGGAATTGTGTDEVEVAGEVCGVEVGRGVPAGVAALGDCAEAEAEGKGDWVRVGGWNGPGAGGEERGIGDFVEVGGAGVDALGFFCSKNRCGERISMLWNGFSVSKSFVTRDNVRCATAYGKLKEFLVSGIAARCDFNFSINPLRLARQSPEKTTNILLVHVTAESFSIEDFVEFCQRGGRSQDFPGSHSQLQRYSRL